MTGDALVRIPGATVYQVEHTTHAVRSIANGDFIVAYATPSGDAGIEAQVGPMRWPLGRWVAALRFDNHTYAFQLPPPDDAAGVAGAAGITGGSAAAGAARAAAAQQAAAAAGPAGQALGCCYFCLTLQLDTPLELIDLLQAVLASGTAYHDYEHLQQRHPPQEAAGGAAAGTAAGAAAAAQQQVPVRDAAASQKAERIAAGLQRGGQLAAAGVLAAASWAGAALQRGADRAVARMQPSDRHPALSPEAQVQLERAKSVAAQAAEVSGRAVAGALSMTAQVAGHLAQRIAESDLGRKMSHTRVAGASAQDLRTVSVAGVEAVEAVYDSLADAARIVLAHTHAAATRVAAHKYGPGAAQAAGAGIQMAQSAVEAGLNMYKLRPTALVKGALKGTAKNVVLGSNGNGGGGGGGGNQLQPAAAGPSVLQQGPAAAAAPPLPPAQALAAASLAAAVSTLAALAGPSQSHAVEAGPYGGGPPATAAAVVVQGIPVTGPVVGQPMLVDYTPSVAALQDASAAPAPAAAPTAAGGAGQGLPYPAVSASPYTARFYPEIPRA